MAYKLGKLAARPDAIPLKLSDYLSTGTLPPPPASFGHESLMQNWKMLLNDRIGDCAIAGPLHSLLLWFAEAGHPITINDAAACVNYEAIAGYRPGPELINPNSAPENPTDQGTDVASMVRYWLHEGLVDGTGLSLQGDKVVTTGTPVRHKIGAAVSLTPGNWDELVYATYYFDGVGIGIECCSEWQEAFSVGGKWDAVRNPNIEGGHYICSVAMRDGNIVIVTWGGTIQMTRAGYEQFNDETVAYASQEKLANGKDLEGLSWSQLRADLPKLRHIKTLQE